MNEITEEELIYISNQFVNMFGVNIGVYRNKEKIFFQSQIRLDDDPADLCIDEIMKDKSEIGYYINDNIFYYCFINHGIYKIVIGPASEFKHSKHESKKNSYSISTASPEKHSLYGIHLDTLLQITILYNFMVNKTMYNISDIRIRDDEQSSISSEIKENDISSVMDTDFYNKSQRTLSIEENIIRKVKNGDIDGLIEGASKVPSVSSGQLALNTLRHQKNFFIRLETIVSRAAYQAGIEANEILSTEEKYIMKCESLDSIDRIKNLQYHMILDYADRVNKFNKYNENNSKLVSDVSRYIKMHISEAIKTSDIANHLGKCRTNLTAEFKKQTGINLSDYIKNKKIQEAKDILLKTDKALSDIAYLLGFSSQSHFCRVFKEIMDETPTEYRNKNHI